MMKYFIYAIAAIHLGCSTSLGEAVSYTHLRAHET